MSSIPQVPATAERRWLELTPIQRELVLKKKESLLGSDSARLVIPIPKDPRNFEGKKEAPYRNAVFRLETYCYTKVYVLDEVE